MATTTTDSDEQLPPGPTDVEAPQLAPFPRWPAVALVVFVIISGLIIAAWQINVPYYALSPGPVEEVGDLIDVEESEVFLLNGDLYMLTVSLQEVNAFEYAQGWLDPAVDLVEREVIRPSSVSPEEHREANRQSMEDSKNTAISVALQHLGFPVTDAGEGVLVTSVLADTPAHGVLEVGDVIIEVDGTPVFIQDDGVNAIVANDIGDTISLKVDRDGEMVDLRGHPDRAHADTRDPHGRLHSRHLQPHARTSVPCAHRYSEHRRPVSGDDVHADDHRSAH